MIYNHKNKHKKLYRTAKVRNFYQKLVDFFLTKKGKFNLDE